MKRIYLNGGGFATVSNQDHSFLSRFSWKIDDHGYPSARIRMHQLLLNVPEGQVCDHKNRRKRDHRRRNLRPVTHAQNLYNARKRKGPTTSIYKGVSWHKRAGLWRAYCNVEKRHIHLGMFRSEIAAAKAYDRAARRYFPEHASLNF